MVAIPRRRGAMLVALVHRLVPGSVETVDAVPAAHLFFQRQDLQCEGEKVTCRLAPVLVVFGCSGAGGLFLFQTATMVGCKQLGGTLGLFSFRA
mmetsp:Transcript_14083/g.34510  ORF Transcript_14083/g.34510 Transcript_14083/m.34510 type:complete len:94 (-) Transcript_14083:9-290(-)